MDLPHLKRIDEYLIGEMFHWGVDGTPHQKAATARTVGGHRQAYVGAGAQPASAATKQSRLVRGAGGCTRRK